jgi:hypothetical protein
MASKHLHTSDRYSVQADAAGAPTRAVHVFPSAQGAKIVMSEEMSAVMDKNPDLQRRFQKAADDAANVVRRMRLAGGDLWYKPNGGAPSTSAEHALQPGSSAVQATGNLPPSTSAAQAAAPLQAGASSSQVVRRKGKSITQTRRSIPVTPVEVSALASNGELRHLNCSDLKQVAKGALRMSHVPCNKQILIRAMTAKAESLIAPCPPGAASIDAGLAPSTSQAPGGQAQPTPDTVRQMLGGAGPSAVARHYGTAEQLPTAATHHATAHMVPAPNPAGVAPGGQGGAGARAAGEEANKLRSFKRALGQKRQPADGAADPCTVEWAGEWLNLLATMSLSRTQMKSRVSLVSCSNCHMLTCCFALDNDMSQVLMLSSCPTCR